VDCLAESAEYFFPYHSKYVINKQARGRTTLFADAQVFRFNCSQNRPRRPTSTRRFSETRNSRSKVEGDCSGCLTVTFLATPGPFDFALHNQHPSHPGRPYFGVPKYLRTWIFDNPRSTPQAQLEDLLSAIEKGEIPGATEKFLKPALIYYWWKKAYRDKRQPSKDPYENVRLFLEDHPAVFVPHCH
jgi:hypothetical protein